MRKHKSRAITLIAYTVLMLAPAASGQTELLERRCGELASSPYDAQRIGNRDLLLIVWRRQQNVGKFVCLFALLTRGDYALS